MTRHGLVGPHSNAGSAVRARLIEAADAELIECGSLTGRMEVVARRAGVSRATAYRQMRSVTELYKEVGLLRARRHVRCLRGAMSGHANALGAIEAGLVYCVHELAPDPTIKALMDGARTSALDPAVYEISAEVMGDVLMDGQQSGEIRVDIDLPSLVHYLAEQCCLASEASDHSKQAVRRRFQFFIVPAVEARSGEITRQVEYHR